MTEVIEVEPRYHSCSHWGMFELGLFSVTFGGPISRMSGPHYSKFAKLAQEFYGPEGAIFAVPDCRLNHG